MWILCLFGLFPFVSAWTTSIDAGGSISTLRSDKHMRLAEQSPPQNTLPGLSLKADLATIFFASIAMERVDSVGGLTFEEFNEALVRAAMAFTALRGGIASSLRSRGTGIWMKLTARGLAAAMPLA